MLHDLCETMELQVRGASTHTPRLSWGTCLSRGHSRHQVSADEDSAITNNATANAHFTAQLLT